MNRNIVTVADLWKEWDEGFASGPPVKALESAWKAQWRVGVEGRFYNRRQIIIREVYRLVSAGNCISFALAVKHLDDIRITNGTAKTPRSAAELH